jgi:penicillin-binding protein 1A
MVKLMERVTTFGTAADLSKAWPGWEVFGKTGTSESNRDVYFAGGTPYYAAASWFGYDNNQVMISTQTGYAKRLWNLAMKELHKNLQIKEIPMPVGVQSWHYCTATGLRATSACPKKEVGWYKGPNGDYPGNLPGYCTTHNGQVLRPDGTLPESTTPPAETPSTSETTTTTTTIDESATTTTTVQAGEQE